MVLLSSVLIVVLVVVSGCLFGDSDAALTAPRTHSGGQNHHPRRVWTADPPARRFYVGAFATQYPAQQSAAAPGDVCAVATFEAVQSPAFQEQFNADGGIVYALTPMPDALDCGLAILPQRGEAPAMLQLSGNTVQLYSRLTKNSLCGGGPYNASMLVGANGNIWANVTDGMRASLSPSGSFVFEGSAAIIDCAVPAPPPTPPPAQRFFLAPFNPVGYSVTPSAALTCTVATLEAYQSAAFRDQYNFYGGLATLQETPNSLACGITVVSNGLPGTLTFNCGNVVPFGLDGNMLCNGPYNSTMMLGGNAVQSDCYQGSQVAMFATITSAMVDGTGIGGFTYSGAMALVDCGTPPPSPAPPIAGPRFFLAPYLAGGYPDHPNCSVATLEAVQSHAFQQQYNYLGGFTQLVSIPTGSGCDITIMHNDGGGPGTLSFSCGQVVPFGLDGNMLCNGQPYNSTMMLGGNAVQSNCYQGSQVAMFASVTSPMLTSFGLSSFSYTSTLAIVDCGTPPPPPPSVTRRFYLAAFDSSGYGPQCSVATLAAVQSKPFRDQYNFLGPMTFLGPISNWVSCDLAVLSHTNGSLSTLSFACGDVVPFGLDGTMLCNGQPYNTTMMLGGNAVQSNCYQGSQVAMFDSLTEDMQRTFGLATFVYTGSLAIVDCGTPPPPPPPPPTFTFYLAAFSAAGSYGGQNCILAALEAFQSQAFVAQYNQNHGLALLEAGVPDSLDCKIAVAEYSGGPSGNVAFGCGHVVAYGRDGSMLCNGPYNSTMKLGGNAVQTNCYQGSQAAMFDSLTTGLVRQASFSTPLASNSTLALIQCGGTTTPS